MLKKSLLVCLLAFFSAVAAQSQGVFKFDAESHEFGEVAEGVQAEHLFKFTNVGNAPIVITNVSASCGCTTPDWSREPVLPGKTGVIKAVYNSQGRPGQFTKSITITSNATEGVKVLRIAGNVVTDPSAQAKQASGELQVAGAEAPVMQLLNKEYNFGTVQVGDKVSRKFKYTNTGKSALQIKSVYSKCRCVTFTASKSALAPGETAELEIVFAPTIASDKPEKVYVATNAPYDANLFITFTGKVVESLTPKSIMQESGGIKF